MEWGVCWQDELPERGGCRDNPDSKFIHFSIVLRTILGRRICQYLSPKSPKPQGIISLLFFLPSPEDLPPAAGASGHQLYQLVGLGEMSSPSVFTLSRTLRKVDRPPSLCTIYTDVRLGMWFIFIL